MGTLTIDRLRMRAGNVLALCCYNFLLGRTTTLVGICYRDSLASPASLLRRDHVRAPASTPMAHNGFNIYDNKEKCRLALVFATRAEAETECRSKNAEQLFGSMY
jgi:hypothetical protein